MRRAIILHATKDGVCDISPKGLKMAVALLCNTTATREMFNMSVHRSTVEALDEMRFTESESNMSDLSAEHQQCLDATAKEMAHQGFIVQSVEVFLNTSTGSCMAETIDVTGSDLESIFCLAKSFTENGQSLTSEVERLRE